MKTVYENQIPSSFYDLFDIEITPDVIDIIKNVKINGDEALREYTKKFDKVEVDYFRVPESELIKAVEEIPAELKKAIEKAIGNVRIFAEKQLESINEFEFCVNPGVAAGQKLIPIKRVGIYAPGGRFPLPSSVIMGAIPAKTAGVEEIALFSPPARDGKISPVTLAAAYLCGINEVYSVGGAQAVAAMAYGTDSIKAVDFIAGPGNKYVAAAKKLVYGRVGIDFIAGPSEVLIIADDSANPDFIAADLLAQAEHDPDASLILLTTSEKLADSVSSRVDEMLKTLPTAATAEPSINNNGLIVICSNMKSAVDIANSKAPEHLEIMVENSGKIIPELKNYGALFIGNNTAEAIGDYIAGPNHTLPTNGVARYTGGLSVHNFIKIVTTLNITEEGIRKIGNSAVTLAKAEGLIAHAIAVEKRIG